MKKIVIVSLLCFVGLIQAMAPEFKKHMEELAAQRRARSQPTKMTPELRKHMEELAAQTRARKVERQREARKKHEVLMNDLALMSDFQFLKKYGHSKALEMELQGITKKLQDAVRSGDLAEVQRLDAELKKVVQQIEVQESSQASA